MTIQDDSSDHPLRGRTLHSQVQALLNPAKGLQPLQLHLLDPSGFPGDLHLQHQPPPGVRNADGDEPSLLDQFRGQDGPLQRCHIGYALHGHILMHVIIRFNFLDLPPFF